RELSLSSPPAYHKNGAGALAYDTEGGTAEGAFPAPRLVDAEYDEVVFLGQLYYAPGDVVGFFDPYLEVYVPGVVFRIAEKLVPGLFGRSPVGVFGEYAEERDLGPAGAGDASQYTG